MSDINFTNFSISDARNSLAECAECQKLDTHQIPEGYGQDVVYFKGPGMDKSMKLCTKHREEIVRPYTHSNFIDPNRLI